MLKHRLFIRVTNDKYQLPIAVTDTAVEMAELQKISRNAVDSACSHNKKGDNKNCFFRVDYTEEEWNEYE